MNTDYLKLINRAQDSAGASQGHDLWMASKEETGLSESEWRSSVRLAEAFIRRYVVSDKEYDSYWYPKKTLVFSDSDNPRAMGFCPSLKTVKNIGGCLFEEADFKYFTSCLSQIGETRFLIEAEEDCELGQRIRFAFPVGITWKEISWGSSIATCLFLGNYGLFRIWGTIPEWGMVTDTDALEPWIFKAYSPKYEDVFLRYWEECYQNNKEIEDEWRTHSRL